MSGLEGCPHTFNYDVGNSKDSCRLCEGQPSMEVCVLGIEALIAKQVEV